MEIEPRLEYWKTIGDCDLDVQQRRSSRSRPYSRHGRGHPGESLSVQNRPHNLVLFPH